MQNLPIEMNYEIGVALKRDRKTFQRGVTKEKDDKNNIVIYYNGK